MEVFSLADGRGDEVSECFVNNSNIFNYGINCVIDNSKKCAAHGFDQICEIEKTILCECFDQSLKLSHFKFAWRGYRDTDYLFNNGSCSRWERIRNPTQNLFIESKELCRDLTKREFEIVQRR